MKLKNTGHKRQCTIHLAVDAGGCVAETGWRCPIHVADANG